MKRREFLSQLVVARTAVAGAGLAMPFGACSLSPSADPIQAGIASVDITPPVGYRMSGYFSERLSTGVADPLFVKALVFRQGSESAALVCCDVIGLTRAVTDRARREAEELSGIPGDNILITATHSHTGPLYYGVLRDYFHEAAVLRQGSDPCETIDYGAQLARGIVDAIAAAQARLTPVQLQAGAARQEGLSFNRRFLMQDGTVRFNPGVLNPDIVRAVGPIDPQVFTVLIRDRATGEPLGAVVNFALHLDTTGGTEYSADYPHYLQQTLQEHYGKGFTLFFATGTCGDINHIDVTTKDRLKPAVIGARLAETVIAGETGLEELESPALALRSRKIRVPLQTYTPEDLEWAQASIGKVGTSELPFLDQVRAYKILDLHARQSDVIELEIQVLRLSPRTAVVSYPGEVFVELGLATKAASPFANTLVVELCQDAPGYLPTRKAFSEGSYETVNSRIAPGGAEAMVETAIELLKELA